MSRSSHQRQQQKLQQQQQLLAQQQQMADNDAAAAAAELFDLFCVATTMRQVLGLHRNMCDLVGLRPAPLNEFYPKLKAKIRSWKAQALWKKFDARAAHRAYSKGTAATGTRVLVIGAGPCGLRTAIEAQLLGAKVVVVEKRDRISRNNVLHLWPFVITDLRNLGAKKFYGKFCAGSIDHISIRQIQCILLKVALLLGVEVHEGVSFDGTIEPNGDGCGWRAAVSPEDHAVSHYEFDVLIGADGKRNTLEGFKRKEFRGKLAIAITANFINKKTEAEAKAEEISGVAFIFNQSFFKELYHTTGIDLENIVYYKDETHYFVMTAKKHSLIDKGVIMQDFADPAELLAPANVNTEKLLDYAREAAEFSTKYQMPNLEFAVNHYGKPDVAMFDFTSMFAAETSCRAIVRKGFRLLQCLVGDSLLEPFWPTGSGCARGFLSSMDAAYAIKLWSNAHNSTLGVLAQRESIYRLLNQTTPENLQRDIGSYTVDPATRYPNLNRTSVNVWQVKHLIDTDDTAILEQTFMDTNALQSTQVDTPVRRKRRSGDSLPLSTVLLRWICAQLHSYEFTRSLKEVSDVFTHGKVLCALINRYRPDLVDFNAIKELSSVECNDIAFRVLEKELNIPRIMTGKDAQQLNTVESKIWLNYLEQICEVFRGEIPHVKHPKMDFSELRDKHRYHANAQPDFSKLLQISTKHKAKTPMQDMVDTTPQAGVQRRSVLDEEKLKRQRKHAAEATAAAAAADQQGHTDTPRRAKKRRSAEKAANIEERQKRLQEIEQNRQDRQSKRRQQRYQQTQNFYKSLHMLQANTLLRESDEASAFEDYSIFMYRQNAPVFNDRVKELERKLLFPDRERTDIPSALPRNATDEQFSDRIKSMEQRITSRNTYGTEKKPKDLMRAIGKIDSSDWNVREIEKKIEQSKKTEIHGPKGREKVPKWSKEQFMARQNKMSKPMRQDSGEEKFKEIDQTLKNLDKQLKEGSVLEIGERGRNKVASIAGQFVKKDDTSDEKNPSTVVQKSSSKVALAFKKQAASEKCHFCKQTVYLMEKTTTEGLILHRSCLKCYHCHTNLRPGGYAFDRDDPNGHFYCTQHFRLPAKAIRPVVRKPGQRKPTQQQQHAAAAAAATTLVKNDGDNVAGIDGEPKTPDKLRGHADSVAQLDLLDRGQTPERIEFENTDAMSDGEPSEEHIIDENEWSGRNFLPESNNDSESDLSSSEESDTESDSDIFEEANDSPLGVQTLQLATDWIGKQNYSDSDDSDDFYDSSDGVPDDGKDDTEGEEFKKARELRREEVRLLPLPANLPTDTETELKLSANENKENIETEMKKSEQAETRMQNVLPLDLDKQSEKSFNSEKSFLSTNLSLNGETNGARRASNTTKADMEKIEQNSDRKFTTEIDEISEKLYRLNNIVKLNKDLENLAKENLVQSDIKKKLTLKEKWLANNNVGTTNSDAAKAQFDEKLEKLLRNSESAGMAKANQEQVQEAETKVLTDVPKESKIPQPSPLTERKNTQLSRNNSLKESKEPAAISPNTSPYVGRKTSATASRSDSFKSTTSSSPKLTPKSVNVSRSNSLKKPAMAISTENKMQLENILDIVKNIDISGAENKDEPESPGSDIGKMLYDAETKFSPKSKRGMTAKLKEIEAKSFAGTMDSIKSQMVMPTVSSQAAPSVDLSKYFPNQKQEKSSSGAVNKNQKNLKDVDLTKYFPSSPVPQKRTTLTVAEKLKKSQTEATVLPATQTSQPAKVSTVTSKEAPKRQASLGSAAVSLREHQLDGAVDLAKRKAPVVKTSTATATATKKGNIKIVKKIVPKGTKAKKAAEAESERILDEILHIDDQDVRSPSLEYKKLFDEEKSPSEDISDKIERILEETGINLGLPKKPATDKTKILLKAKSLGEGEFERNQCKLSDKSSNSSLSAKEDGDQPAKGVQNILRRFESLSSFKSQEQPFKLQRMESSTSNLNKSRESLVSRESDSLSDLDKTMEYLKTEWRNEATNFLQKKRDKFYAHKRSVDEVVAVKTEQQKKSRLNELPVQYRESKLAKFFGIKQKSPEKKKSPVKKKSPQKTKISEKKKSPEKKLQATTKVVQKSTTPSVTTAENISKKSLENQTDLSGKKTADILKKTGERTLTSESPTRKSAKETDEKLTKSRARADTASSDKMSDAEEKIPKASEIIAKLEGKLGVKQTLRTNEIEAEPTISAPKATKQLDVTDSSTRLVDDVKTDKNNDLSKSNFAHPAAIETLETKMEVVDRATANPDQLAAVTSTENRRPLVEDIKNLPKFGCDKSLNNSRRGSQTSLQSRRQSDASLTDQLEKAAIELSTIETTVESIFQEIVQQLDDSSETCPKDLAAGTKINDITKEAPADLCKDESYSLSLSTSFPQTTVQLRGSSEDESIEKLFGQFSDDMLVDVEFDSHDELVAITPRAVSRNIVETEAEADRDFLGKLESLEKDPEVIEVNISKLIIMPEPTQKNDLLEDNSSALAQFPVRPQRRQKSSSSSSEPSAPIVPQRIKKKLAKLDPTDMPPSVQDVLQEIFSTHIEPENERVNEAMPLKFPQKIFEDENFGAIIPQTDGALEDKKLNAQTIEEKQSERRLSSDISQQTLILASHNANEAIMSDAKRQTESRSTTKDNISDNTNKKDESDSTIPEYKFRKHIDAKIEDTDSLHGISCSLATTPEDPSLNIRRECDEKNMPNRRLSNAKVTLSREQSFESNEKKECNIKSVEIGVSQKKQSPTTESKVASPKTEEKSKVLDSEREPINRKSSLTSLKSIESNSSTNSTQQTSNDVELTTTPLYRRLSAASLKYKNSQKNNEKSSMSTTQQTELLTDQKKNKTTTELNTPNIIVTENRRPSQDSLTSNNSHSSKRNSSAQTTTTTEYSNAHSKENSLDWDMEKIPASPMPRRKFVHAERGPYQETTHKEQTSRTSSTKSLNITQELQENTVADITEEEQRLMTEFERERREFLPKRDKECGENHKILDITVPKRRNSTLDVESDASSAQAIAQNSQRSVSPSEKFEQERRQALAKRDKEYEEHQKLLLERRQSATETDSIKSLELQTSTPLVSLKSAELEKPVPLVTLTLTDASPETLQRSVSPSEKFEQERRQALAKRDKEYEEHQKLLLERRQSATETDSIKSLELQTSTPLVSLKSAELEKPFPLVTLTPTEATPETLQRSASPSEKLEQERRQALTKRDKEYEEHQKTLIERRQSITENQKTDSIKSLDQQASTTLSASIQTQGSEKPKPLATSASTQATEQTSTTSTPVVTETPANLDKPKSLLTTPAEALQKNPSPSEKFEHEHRQALVKRDKEYAEQHKTLAVTVPKSQSTTENQEHEFTKNTQQSALLATEAHKSQETPSILEQPKVPLVTLAALHASQSKESPTEKFEQERRQALAKRDKEYAENHKIFNVTVPKEFKENSANKKTSLATEEVIKPTLTLAMLNTSQSRESPTEQLEQERLQALRQRDKEYAEHHKTVFVTIPKRHNSTDDKESDTFKKDTLQTSKGIPVYMPDSDDNDEPIPEAFKNRSWPKRDVDVRSKSVESADNMEHFVLRLRKDRTTPKSESPINDVLKHRAWPQSNQRQRHRDNAEMYAYPKNSSPHNSTHSLKPGQQPRSSQSSVDTEANSFKSSRSVEHINALPQRHKAHVSAVDTGTRLLLDRGKDLHDRKRDFMNERVAERNCFVKTRQMNNAAYDVDNDDDDVLESYRPKNHTSSSSRKFPTTRTPVRTSNSRHFDYLSTTPTSLYPGLRSSGGSKRLYTSTIPTAAASSSHNYLHYPSHSTAYTSSAIPTRTHFADYFRRSPSNHRDRSGELSKESCVQTDSESTSSNKVEQNSATEISTDSEFDHDEIIRETPKIFIDDTHLRKPTKVQVKSSIISPSMGQKYHTATPGVAAQTKGGSYLQKYQTNHQPLQPQFKPLVQVDPSVLCANRMPLQNPRPGDYLLNKTASTEGIASKKSLELKKRYLLGEQGNGSKIQKSGSTSVLDSKIRSFHSNISECQKLLNPSNDISPTMKNFLDRTKLGEQHSASDASNILRHSATGNILNDLKVEITIQKASSTASTDNEKENLFVNSKNELNKGMEYSETVNTTLVESLSKKSPTTPTNNQTIIETIDLVTPEKKTPIIDLTQVEIPTKMLESNVEFINNIDVSVSKDTITHTCSQLLHTDSNKILDATCESPVKSDTTVIEDVKPDVSKDVKECIPDIIEHIESCDVAKTDNKTANICNAHGGDEEQLLLSNSYDEEKKDSPEKNVAHDYEHDDLQIQVPNIPWSTRKLESCSSSASSNCTSNTSSIEDIQHYILESTTSPDTQTAPNGHQVPRLEVHDTAGELMQIDSLMIIDGRYIGDSEDLKLMDIPEGLIIPDVAPIKTSEIDDEPDIEPITATPEPADHTVIEAEFKEAPPLPDNGPPLPERGPPKMKPIDLKFDTKNENKVESLKNLPLIVEQTSETCHAMKPLTLNLKLMQQSANTPTTTKANNAVTPLSPLVDNDKTPTAELYSRGSDSETEATGTGQVLTETELSDWTADDCISENFIDIEFVLNSSKDTIKRNKNGAKKKKTLSSYKQLPMIDRRECSKVNDSQMAPVAEFEGILRNLDIDEIEFMDTGSEGSCAEAYSATNTAMLRNRGYMEYIETAPKITTPSHKMNEDIRSHSSTTNTASNVVKYKPVPTKRDEILGIDYIEQGAYIMQRGDSHNDLLKTPVNELPSQTVTPTSVEKALRTQLPNALTQSLTDSSTLNDVDDDSLGLGTTNSATNTKTTTDESEALTVVTSPLDSSSPKMAEAFAVKGSLSTPSSSDKNPKTSTISTCTPATSSNATSSRQDILVPTSTGSNSVPPTTSSNSAQRQSGDDLSYEEYVRALQQKITQISNARDSLDTRKQRRKSSKGEAPLTTFSSDAQTVIEKTRIAAGGCQSEKQLQTPACLALAATQPVDAAIVAQPADAASAQVHKVPEIPTLTRRLEEITKERTKQKDLIHDLVMDKLQSKKQLNAEKRLHRSRQRTILTSGGCGYTSGSSLSPTPKLAAASTTTDTNCTNKAHYHVSTSAVRPPTERQAVNERSSSTSFKENNPLQKSATYVAAYRTDVAVSPTKAALAYKQRPFSEHIAAEQVDPLERYKLTKTPSFSYPMSTSKRNLNSQQPIKEQQSTNYIFKSPIAPMRNNRGRSSSSATVERSVVVPDDDELSVVVSAASTEKLRTEARARARLKSNNELGLSPEEKMQLLRKRLHLEDVIASTVTPSKSVNKVLSSREHKMSSSKSVNDLVTAGALYGSKLNYCAADENSNTTQSAVIADFTSDPNLLLSSKSQAAAVKTIKSSKSNRRSKDPERRKSIIQSLSNFFHMGSSSGGGGAGSSNAVNKKDSSNAGATASAANSAQPERPGTSGSSTTSSSVDGVFSRFRMTAKSKEKSKDKDAGHIDASIRSHATKTTQYERSNSQDCILNTRTNNNSNTKHNNLNHHHKHLQSSSAASVTAKYSASSPQLYVAKNNVASHVDEQIPPPIPPLPLNYQRSDDESYATETREQKKQRSLSKAVRQAELKRLRIAQEIQREQEEIEVQLKELEARGVLIEKALRGEGQHVDSLESTNMMGASDEKLLKELLEIWRNITQLKKRDDELGIRQQELQLEHRHAQLKEELNVRLSSSKLDKSSADVAAEGAILNEMLEIVAKRAALRPTATTSSAADKETKSSQAAEPNTNIEFVPKAVVTTRTDTIKLNAVSGQSFENNESQI